LIYIKNIIFTTSLIGNKYQEVNKIPIYNFPFIKKIKNKNISKIKNSIIYVGGITKIRGFDQIIDSFNIINKKGIKFTFNIVGPIQHEEYKNELLRKISEYNLNEYITFHGLIPYNEVFEHIEKSIVGMLCYLPEPNHLVTFPNKIFEYISVGTPVIASNFPLYKQIINESKCGMLVNPLNPIDIAEKLEYSILNQDKMIELGENGKKSVLLKYNWDVEEQKLLSYYKQLLGTIFES